VAVNNSHFFVQVVVVTAKRVADFFASLAVFSCSFLKRRERLELAGGQPPLEEASRCYLLELVFD
jgi:hypothetical protein